MELLTEIEKEVIRKAEELWRLINEAIPDGQTREDDLRELAANIHAIQRAFMCNAAARAYPWEFRPLGGIVREAKTQLKSAITTVVPARGVTP